jgi:hypothetical protein
MVQTDDWRDSCIDRLAKRLVNRTRVLIQRTLVLVTL